MFVNKRQAGYYAIQRGPARSDFRIDNAKSRPRFPWRTFHLRREKPLYLYLVSSFSITTHEVCTRLRLHSNMQAWVFDYVRPHLPFLHFVGGFRGKFIIEILLIRLFCYLLQIYCLFMTNLV